MIKVIKKDQQTSDTLNRYAALNTLKSRKQTGTYDAAIKDAMWQAKEQRIPVYFYGEDKFGAWFWRNTTNESDINPNKSSGSRILKIVYDDTDGFSLYDCEIAEVQITPDMQDAGSIAGYKMKVEKNKIGLFHITASLNDTIVWKSEAENENGIRGLLQQLKYDPDKLRWYIRNWEGTKMKELSFKNRKPVGQKEYLLAMIEETGVDPELLYDLNADYEAEVKERGNDLRSLNMLIHILAERTKKSETDVWDKLHDLKKSGAIKLSKNMVEIPMDKSGVEELSRSSITEHPAEPSEYDVKPIPKKKAKKEEKVLTLKQKLHGAGIRDMKQVKQIEKNVDQYVKMMQSAKSVVEKDGAYIITTKDGGTHKVSGIIGDYAYRRTVGGSSKPQGKELTDDEMNRLYTAAMYVEKYDKHVPKNGARYIHFQKIHGTKCLIGTDTRHMYVSVFDYPDTWDNKGILVEGEENFIDRLKKTEKAYYTDEAIILGEYEFSLEETDNRISNIERIVPASEDMIHQITIDDEFMTNCRKSLKRYMKDVKFQPVYFLENRTAMFHEYTTVIEKIDTPFKVELSRVIKAWDVVSPETIDVYNGVVVIPGESEFVLIAKMTLVEMDYEEIKSQG